MDIKDFEALRLDCAWCSDPIKEPEGVLWVARSVALCKYCKHDNTATEFAIN